MPRGGRAGVAGHNELMCIGCGVCAGVCPAGAVEMVLGHDGCYRAVRAEQGCSRKCGLCERVCPFSSTEHNEDSIGKALYADQPGVGHSSECGYYLSCASGHCADLGQRLNSASGGIATAFLKRLFADGAVDRAVCVTRSPGSTPLFRYSIIDNASDLDNAAKSAYYPVELSEILREVARIDARYAVVCLPCVAKALRLAQMYVPLIKERIVAVLGLVCGHGVSSYFAEFAGELAGAPRNVISEVVFRTKTPSLPASELGTLVKWLRADGGQLERTVLWSEGVGESWSGHWFTPGPCFYCDDVFAECADVAFMDAWLPGFVDDYRGTSLMVVRSERARMTLEAAANAGELCLSDRAVDRVVESQAGVVSFKREGLAHRLWRASKTRQAVPTKRVISRQAGNGYAASQWDAEVNRSKAGLVLWPRCESMEEFRSRIRGITGGLAPLIRIRRLAKRFLDRTRSVLSRNNGTYE